MVTTDELIEELKEKCDPDEILDLLKIDTPDLVWSFEERVEARIDDVKEYLGYSTDDFEEPTDET